MPRLADMRKKRVDAADGYVLLGEEPRTPNGDFLRFADRRATFTKGLPHNATTGLVDNPATANKFYQDLETNQLAISSSATAPFVNPQAGIAYDTEGPDAQQLQMPAAPAFDSDVEVAEIAENYWMALLRDVPFESYSEDPIAAEAAAHLSTLTGYENVTPGTLFRGGLEGDATGPYLSQFMLWDAPYGAQKTPATMAYGLPAGFDYLTDFNTYVAVQNGQPAPGPGVLPFDTPRYLASGRDISQYVHIDELFQAYLNACLVMITPPSRGGFGVLSDEGNPYTGADLSGPKPVARKMNQTGFGTLGEPNFKTIVAEISTRALKSVWCQKWLVHRRLRPEAYGARIHAQITGAVSGMIPQAHIDQLQPVLDRVKSKTGTYLLPMAFPEGCPYHPAYGAGHATVAGACVTILKALFHEQSLLSDLGVQPKTIDLHGNRSAYGGADSGSLSVLGELNKLVSNVGLARNIAGVHWRSDFTQSIILGERIALYFLQEYIRTYNEPGVSFHVRTFEKTDVTITQTSLQKFPALKVATAGPGL